jgi:orotidine-5'-phosphate decarboxylase
MTSDVLDRLIRRRAAIAAPLCVGIDPHPDALPGDLPRNVGGIEAFGRTVLERAGPWAAAVKINTAFFEAFGAAGWAALERLRQDVPRELVCVIDAKRGDIGSTAERHAEALFGRLDADAVTLSPYLGEDAVEPFLAWPDRLVYLLARTSNPSAGQVQELVADGEPVHVHVARWAAGTWTDGRVGLVVGATEPADLANLRRAVPGPAFLVPGVGAQGGDLATAAAYADGDWAPGLVNVSRAISGAGTGPDWASEIATAAETLRDRMAEAVLDSKASSAPAASRGGS